ncbi:ketopantoate reductase family protein [Reyranella sp. CPCC 100927]|uniref:ketopantoate reductase family protein n=1 Tax=Reyranella sp. CPCC 100927 TaxID=2599616 RepID=UPI0015B62D85|nr:2-dehydropantoate 2-reductase [Reyranella sp. CPCC 100927]
MDSPNDKPNPDRPRIVILGAGAVGGYIGGNLARAGHDVILVDPWAQHVDHMRRHGLRLEGTSAEECFTTPVRALHLGELHGLWREKRIDIGIILLKSYDTPWAAMMLRDLLAPGGFVVTMQNAINEPAIADVVGWPRTVGGIANKIVVELVAPGHVRRSIKKGGGGFEVFRIGEVHGRITPRIQRLKDMLADIDSAKVITNLWGERWSKVVQNAMSNAVSAACGLPTKTYIEEPLTRRLSIRIAGEAADIGQRLGYQLEAINGQEPSLWIEAWRAAGGQTSDTGALQRAEAILLDLASRMVSTARPSMGQDIVKGRRTEIDYLNGMIARQAADHGLQAPANAALTRVVQAIEQGRTTPGLDAVRAI